MNGGGGHLKAVAKGASWVAAGNIGAMLIRLVTGILVIRFIAMAEYGLVALAYVVVSFGSAISMLGLRDGIARFMGELRGKEGSVEDVGRLSGTALAFSLTSGVLFALLFAHYSEAIAAYFKKPDLEPVLLSFAFLVPALVLARTLSAIYRGAQQSKQKVIFEDWLSGVMRLSLLVVLFSLGFGLQGVIIAYVASMWLGVLVYAAYSVWHLPGRQHLSFDVKLARELLWFSLPLLGMSLFGQLGEWVNTVVLGLMKTAEDVALYSAPIRLMALLTFPVVSIRFIYGPLAARLFAGGNGNDIGVLYKNVSKWSAVLTLPLMIYLFVDAQFIVTLMFGDEYADAALVMRILIIGYGLHGLIGPNGATLIFSGNPRPTLYCSILGVSVSISLALLLIPRFGALGSAAAASAGLVASNLAISITLFKLLGIHPVHKEYVISIASIIMLGILLYLVTGGASHPLLHLAAFALFYLLSISVPIITRNLSEDDLSAIAALENRLLKSTRVTESIRLWVCKTQGRASGR